MKANNLVVHQNLYNESGEVFCKKRNKVLSPNEDLCNKCEYCVGSLQGRGVECYWYDVYDNSIVTVNDPNKEKLRVSKLIDKNIIKKG